MSQSYQVNDSNVYAQQLTVQEITIPFTITHNATEPSNVLQLSSKSYLPHQSDFEPLVPYTTL